MISIKNTLYKMIFKIKYTLNCDKNIIKSSFSLSGGSSATTLRALLRPAFFRSTALEHLKSKPSNKHIHPIFLNKRFITIVVSCGFPFSRSAIWVRCWRFLPLLWLPSLSIISHKFEFRLRPFDHFGEQRAPCMDRVLSLLH